MACMLVIACSLLLVEMRRTRDKRNVYLKLVAYNGTVSITL